MTPAYVGVAGDLLRENGFDEAAQALQAATGVELLRSLGFEHEAEVLESCIQWSEDTECCHLCGRYMMHDDSDGEPIGHDDDCPVGLISSSSTNGSAS